MKSHLAPWDAADIAELLLSRPRESRTIDYKRKLPGGQDSEVNGFLVDVSAFANAVGGVIVYGIDEKDGEPIECVGIEESDSDAAIRRLESIIGNNLDPPLRGCHFDPIAAENGKPVLVLRIPQSPSAPHMIKKGSPKFYNRGAAGNTPMDTCDLRSAFLSSEGMVEKARQFVKERCVTIAEKRPPFQLRERGYCVMHIILASAILRPVSASMAELETAAQQFKPPYEGRAWGPVNYYLEGLGMTAEENTQGSLSHVLFFRNGIIEASCPARSPRSENQTGELIWLKAFRDCLPIYEAVIRRLGAAPPYFVFSTLIGCDGTLPFFLPGQISGVRVVLLSESILTFPAMEWIEEPVDWIAVLRHFSILYANRSGLNYLRYFKPDGQLVQG